MDFHSYYAPDGDIAYIRVRTPTGTVRSQEEPWGVRDYDRGSGQLVGIEVWAATKVLPRPFIDALPRLEEADADVEPQRRSGSG